MSWDVAIIAFLVLAGLRGFWRGMFREAGSLVGCLAGIVVGWRSAVPMAESVRNGTGSAASQLDAALVFLGIFIGLWMVGGLIGWGAEKLVRSPVVAWISGAGGMVVGAMKGAAIAGACIVFAQLFVPQAEAQLERAAVARWLGQTTSAAATWLVQRQTEPQ